MFERALVVLLCGIVLVACGAPPPDLSVPEPPGAMPYASGRNPNVDQLLATFDRGVQDALTGQGFTIQRRQDFSTTASVATIERFYADELVRRGWEPVPSGFSNRSTQALLAYQKSNALLVIAAIDTAPYAGQGAVIYTLQATK